MFIRRISDNQFLTDIQGATLVWGEGAPCRGTEEIKAMLEKHDPLNYEYFEPIYCIDGWFKCDGKRLTSIEFRLDEHVTANLKLGCGRMLVLSQYEQELLDGVRGLIKLFYKTRKSQFGYQQMLHFASGGQTKYINEHKIVKSI